MKHTTAESPAFAGSIPADYDAHLGPFLFDFYASDLAARIDLQPEARILETACGTGILTEALRWAAPGTCEIVATDVSESMLERARLTRGRLERTVFEAADASALPYEDGSFDALFSQFGLMFIPDKLQAMREAHRVLRPGGRVAFSVWGDLGSNPFVGVAQSAIASFFRSDPPEFLFKPWSYSDPGPIRDLLGESGFSGVRLTWVWHTWEGAASEEVARGLVCGNPTIGDVLERATAPVEDVIAAVASSLRDAFGRECVRIPMQALVVTATR